MPAERGYEQQTGPSAGTMLPGRDSQEFGAGVGDALGQMGGQIHAQQVRAFQVDKKIEQDRQLSDWSHRYALHKENMDGIAREARSQSDPGGAGHGGRVRQANEAARDKLFEGITDPAVRRMAEQQWDGFSGALYGQEDDWTEAQRIAKAHGNNVKARALMSSRVFHDPSKLGAELQDGLLSIEMLNAPPDLKDKLAREFTIEAHDAAAQSLAATDPAGFRAAAQQGQFDVLGADRLAQLDRSADVEIRAREHAEKAAQAAKAADFNERMNTVVKGVGDGQPIDDKVFEGLEKEAEDLGIKADKRYDLQQARVTNSVGREYRSATPIVIANDLAALDAKIAKQGDKAPVELTLRRNALEKVLTSRRSQIGNDPLGEAAKSGVAVPAVDWNNPAPGQVQGRVQAAYTAQRLYGGQLTVLRPDEVAIFRGEYENGGPSKLKVLSGLDRIPDAFARQAAAEQIAPKDRQFQQMAQMRPEHRATVERGRQALAHNPKMLNPAEGDPQGAAATVTELNRDIDLALTAMQPDDAAAIKTSARQYYAGWLSGHGYKSVDEQFSREGYLVAIRAAGGGKVTPTLSTGGLGYWNGNPFWVPDGFGHEGFQLATRRDRLEQEKAGGGPVQPDGKTPFDLNKAWPVMIAPGKYRWDTKGGTVRDRRGGTYITSVEAGR